MRSEEEIKEVISDCKKEIEVEEQLLRDIDHRPEDSVEVKTLLRRINNKKVVISWLQWVME